MAGLVAGKGVESGCFVRLASVRGMRLSRVKGVHGGVNRGLTSVRGGNSCGNLRVLGRGELLS